MKTPAENPMPKVVNTGVNDLEQIYSFFEASILYQESHGYPVWRNYDRQAIIKDLNGGNQYKLVIGSTTALVFSVCFSDPVIWRERDRGASVYLHRMVVNPEYKGRRLFGHVLNWLRDYARQKGLKTIRMDTWAASPNLVSYYKSFGFSVVENFTTPNSPQLPVHNRNLALTLLQCGV